MANATTKKTTVKKVAPKTAIKTQPVAKPVIKPIIKPVVKMAPMSAMIPADFISNDKVSYGYCLGKVVASSFSGFLAGIIVSSLIWIVVVNVFFVG